MTAWLAEPDARLDHSDSIRLMLESIEAERDPARGLHAAALVKPGDREPIEHAARGCATLGEAFAGLARWFPLLNEATELSLETSSGRATVCYRVVRGEPEPPAFADSVIAGLVYFTRRNARVDEAGFELHFTQPRPDYADEYARFFDGPVRFGAKHDALVLPADRLREPMLPRSATLTRAFQLHADRLLREQQERHSTVARVRHLVGSHLDTQQVTMQWAAEQLEVSVATLRRRLREENTTFSSVFESLRLEVAERKLREGRASISEIAYALGFANLGAFTRAFKRWRGSAPSDYRDRARRR